MLLNSSAIYIPQRWRFSCQKWQIWKYKGHVVIVEMSTARSQMLAIYRRKCNSITLSCVSHWHTEYVRCLTMSKPPSLHVTFSERRRWPSRCSLAFQTRKMSKFHQKRINVLCFVALARPHLKHIFVALVSKMWLLIGRIIVVKYFDIHNLSVVWLAWYFCTYVIIQCYDLMWTA